MNKQEMIDYINDNPEMSIRKIAKTLGVAKTTIGRLKKSLSQLSTSTGGTLSQSADSAVTTCSMFHIDKECINDIKKQLRVMKNSPPDDRKSINEAEQYIIDTLEGYL
jgi:IS30 family transposase